jgi:DNA-binding transcriptional MerR regulator
MNHKELIAKLRVGAGIEREKVVYSGWAPLADEAADAIEEMQAALEECRKSNSIVSKAFDFLERERDEYQQAADKMAMEHKVERDTLRQQLAEAQKDAVPTEITEAARAAIEAMLEEYNYPANPHNAARAGWRACRLHIADMKGTA